MTTRELHSGWELKATSPSPLADRSIPAPVPGTVHRALLEAEVIANPFDGENEREQRWIGETSWEYSCSFDWSGDGEDNHDLVAYGLDSVATVELNGHVLGHTENQHRSYRFRIDPHLEHGTNTLVVRFASPLRVVRQRDLEHGGLPHFMEHPFNALRKMASNFGWDWGIDLSTSGIWRPIEIHGWSTARIEDVRPLVTLNEDEGRLDAHVRMTHASDARDLHIDVLVADELVTASLRKDDREVSVAVSVSAVKRWWPVGHGEQPLYPVQIRLREGDRVLDTWDGRVGFRTVTVDTAPDAAGAPFTIIINDKPIVIRGANWIPDHADLTLVDSERYETRLKDALEANMNLLRVWGGGIYETEDFYRLCDEMGILVWQDFLFACAAYSEDEWLANEVEAEAREAVTRLSQHPSLVVWNGNNENIWAFHDWGWRRELDGRAWGNRYYRELLPQIVAELDPTRPYSPASPYSFADYMDPNEPSSGTMHIWDAWNRRDYRAYRDHKPRFAAEFGFQGPPAWSTLVGVVHDEPLTPNGAHMLSHQKQDDGQLKLERNLRGNMPEPSTIEDWHWATQLNQAHAFSFGIEHFRSLHPHNMGTVLWQLNDNWPVISWSLVDFDGHRKPAWYAVRDAYEPRLLTIQPRNGGLALIALNDTDAQWESEVSFRRLNFDGTELATQSVAFEVKPRSGETLYIPEHLASPESEEAEVLVAETPDAGRAMWDFVPVVKQRLHPEPYQLEVISAGTDLSVKVSATSYVRDLFVQADRLGPVARCDWGLCSLLPGESALIRITGSSLAVLPSGVIRSANDLLLDAGVLAADGEIGQFA